MKKKREFRKIKVTPVIIVHKIKLEVTCKCFRNCRKRKRERRRGGEQVKETVDVTVKVKEEVGDLD